MLIRRLVLLCATFVAAAAVCGAQSAGHLRWVGSWAASPMQTDGGFAMRPLCGNTLRQVVHLSTGGAQVRLRFSNAFGLDPLTIADAHVALSAGGAKIQEGSDHAVTFGGAASVVIPPGAEMFSDPVAMTAAPLADLAVSVYIPAQVMRTETYHAFAGGDNFEAQGDVAGAADLANPATLHSWYFFDGIDVPAVEDARAIVAFGDSITDGARMTMNSNHRWPNFLAARLGADKQLAHVSVLDEGIGGNRVLNDVAGPNALARFNRDVLAQDGVQYLIVLESINDIGHLSRPTAPYDEVTTEQLEEGLKQMADAAHQHGIKIYAATLTPFKGAAYWSEKGEQMREAVNEFIRTSKVFDGVVDFDKATQDLQNPLVYNPQYDSGDHLHPNDAGYQTMGNAIDLALFK